MRETQVFRKQDFLWLLASPLYLLLGTIRHEGAHALAGILEGASVENFVVLPSVVDGSLRFGYVLLSGKTTWLMSAAPYFADLLIAILCFGLLLWCSMPLWMKINVLILGPISSFIDSFYNYLKSFFGAGDVESVLSVLPSSAVHVYFLATLLFYVVGVAYVWEKSKKV